MSHKTIVNGTSYDVKGGKCLVNGTSYDIKKGRTLINGTGYDITFAPPTMLVKGDLITMNLDGTSRLYRVLSVNGQTGTVTISVPTVPSTTSILKGNGSGGVVAATRGSDYIASGNIVKQTLVATETTPTENYAINWVYG